MVNDVEQRNGTADPAAAAPPALAHPGLAIVADALARLRFGDIRLTVHDGRLVQVDVTERTRLPHG